MEEIDLLLDIVEKTGIFGESNFTTVFLSKKFKVSQQTISNMLISLENDKLIKRIPFNKGIKISISNEGRVYLENYKKKFDEIFKTQNEIEGIVFSGLGEGKFYVSQAGYKKQFEKILKIRTYDGTLNLKVNPDESKKFLLGKKPIHIESFKTASRTFGELLTYKIKINDVLGHIVIPARTHYKGDTMEIISEFHLRDKLKLKDGDKVIITSD